MLVEIRLLVEVTNFSFLSVCGAVRCGVVPIMVTKRSRNIGIVIGIYGQLLQ